MRIELVTQGGFAALPGLNRPIVLDCAALPAAVAAECEALASAVRAAGSQAAPAALRDGRSYRLTITADGQAETYTAADQAMGASFERLLQLVRQHGHR
jgi:hypothetical protein